MAPVEAVEQQGRAGRRAWLVRVGLLVVALAITVVMVRLVGRIDWHAVGRALGELAWWQPLVLVAVVAVRQVLNGMPLAFYIRGVSVVRATINDLGAVLMSAIAPPPSDLALRVAMFTSWGVPAAKGVAGTLMNTLTFYIVRFSAPALGFVLLAATDRPAGLRKAEVLSIAIAVGITVAVFLVLRSESLATSVGTTAGRWAKRVRRSVDPEAWAEACRTFRHDISATFRYGFGRSLLAMTGLLAADYTVLVLSLRFVGLSTAAVGLVGIAIAYLFAYPFTLFPFSGIGIVDALILAALVEEGGAPIEATAVAGLLVWRVFTVGLPVLMGLGALVLWRRSVASGGGSGTASS
ncbi:lysylphosphatidylglycerol synthase domain-containing protein [Nocardioides sp.]|uniref:lysylphosphatidylglycerol synthase domain-containing protein n=1 Tax=Nocardioides sp. TaxID=35761 RepID=UPI003527F8B3